MDNLVKYEDCIIRIKDISDIFMLAERLDFHVFRGQGQDWEIESRLSRILKPLKIDEWNYKNREHNIIDEFKARIELYRDFNVNTKDYVECCSLIQHYGGPTRLIDFTDSFFVAVFFAIENIESNHDAVIWGFADFILGDINCRNELIKPSFGNRRKVQHEKMVEKANQIFNNEEEKETGLLVIRPRRKNERLSRQQGLFLMHENIKISFMDNLNKCFSRDFEENAKEVTLSDLNELHYLVFVIKIIIPARIPTTATIIIICIGVILGL
ncbi:FRG domain-containing protein [Patescibacteria group bacterium]|nr:FRG domain-containing protein [Patescibacteria group bacterium]